MDGTETQHVRRIQALVRGMLVRRSFLKLRAEFEGICREINLPGHSAGEGDDGQGTEAIEWVSPNPCWPRLKRASQLKPVQRRERCHASCASQRNTEGLHEQPSRREALHRTDVPTVSNRSPVSQRESSSSSATTDSSSSTSSLLSGASVSAKSSSDIPQQMSVFAEQSTNLSRRDYMNRQEDQQNVSLPSHELSSKTLTDDTPNSVDAENSAHYSSDFESEESATSKGSAAMGNIKDEENLENLLGLDRGGQNEQGGDGDCSGGRGQNTTQTGKINETDLTLVSSLGMSSMSSLSEEESVRDEGTSDGAASGEDPEKQGVCTMESQTHGSQAITAHDRKRASRKMEGVGSRSAGLGTAEEGETRVKEQTAASAQVSVRENTSRLKSPMTTEVMLSSSSLSAAAVSSLPASSPLSDSGGSAGAIPSGHTRDSCPVLQEKFPPRAISHPPNYKPEENPSHHTSVTAQSSISSDVLSEQNLLALADSGQRAMTSDGMGATISTQGVTGSVDSNNASVAAEGTSIWSSDGDGEGDDEGGFGCSVQDVDKLKEMRGSVAMELLWIQQAIESRKNYLRLKRKIGDGTDAEDPS